MNLTQKEIIYLKLGGYRLEDMGEMVEWMKKCNVSNEFLSVWAEKEPYKDACMLMRNRKELN